MNALAAYKPCRCYHQYHIYKGNVLYVFLSNYCLYLNLTSHSSKQNYTSATVRRSTTTLVTGTNTLTRIKPLIGCIAYSTAINLHRGLPAWSTAIFFDTVLFSITLIKTWKACKQRILFSSSGKLTTLFVGKLAPCSQLFAVLLRDGFILYAIMLSL